MVKCANCETENPDGAKFCFNCGVSLTAHCPNCGAELPPNAKFCPHCGHPVAAANPAKPATTSTDQLQRYMPRELQAKLDAARANRSMEGERRIVTMLFCDVKGSTGIAETLDPEEWVEIINQIFERMITAVYRYEGTIARLMGDAILAFFGAPIAHEDDPERAARAGLSIIETIRPLRGQMQRERGLDFNVRVGINTGLVVVGEVGSDMRVEYTAMGDAVNLAARMEQTAEPGTIQISEQTYKLIAPLFECQTLGEIEVKGKREPVATYRVLRGKPRPASVRGIAGLDSPMVGRDREFDLLLAQMEELQQGRGSIASVMGEAGLGKSRLMAELRRRVTAEAGPSIVWYEGRSLSFQTTTPYTPFVDLFGKLFGIDPEDTQAARYATLKTRIEQISPDRTPEIAPFIASLLGIELAGADSERVRFLEPPQLHGRVFDAVSALFEQLASQQPLVLVFEDLHWADPTSLDLIEHLLKLTNQAMVMLIMVLRPQRQDPAWHVHEVAARDYAHRSTTITLQPLDEDHSRILVGNLLEIEDLPASVRQLILDKAEGNPFFVEEVIRSLLDARLIVPDGSHWRATHEIARIAVPDTLAGVITARLDRLDENAKHVAQAASVVGREFQKMVLDDIYDPRPALENALDVLQQRELIRERSRVPQQVFLFKHVLTQETAYASLLLSRRRELHRQVAECLEKNDPSRVGDLARHWLEAGEPERALPYLVEAADRASHVYSTREAIQLYEQALAVSKTLPGQDLAQRIYEGLGGALALSGEPQRALDIYTDMLNTARTLDNIPMQVSAFNKQASVVALGMGQFPEAQPRLANAEQLARQYNDRVGLAETANTRCMMCGLVGDFEGMARYMGEVVQISREINLGDNEAKGLAHIANALNTMTRFDEAWEKAQEGLEVSRRNGDLLHEAEILMYPAVIYHLREGEIEAAQQSVEVGLAISRRIGALDNPNPMIGVYILGEIARLRGDYEQATARYQEAVEMARPLAQMMPFVVVMPLAALGTAYIEISTDLVQQAGECHDEAAQLLDNLMGMIAGGTAWADIGFCALALGRYDKADEFFQKGLTIDTMLSLINRSRFLAGSALVALHRNQVNEALRLVSEARAFVEEKRIQYLYPETYFLEGRVHAALGDHEQALVCFDEAETSAKALGARPWLWQAWAAAARSLDALGRADEAVEQRAAAQIVVDEIAALLQDEALHSAFVENASQQLAASATGD
ncbi:MAG: AAA family ATPase [Anaerolineae bacterium]|nr:AAA family ATPase [Anaerolineae bacterium]